MHNQMYLLSSLLQHTLTQLPEFGIIKCPSMPLQAQCCGHQCYRLINGDCNNRSLYLQYIAPE